MATWLMFDPSVATGTVYPDGMNGSDRRSTESAAQVLAVGRSIARGSASKQIRGNGETAAYPCECHLAAVNG